MNRKTGQQREAELPDAIMRFLAEQHQAISLEKIVEWWIARQPVSVDIKAVARAVHKLTEQDLLEGSGEGRARRYQLKNTSELTEEN